MKHMGIVSCGEVNGLDPTIDELIMTSLAYKEMIKNRCHWHLSAYLDAQCHPASPKQVHSDVFHHVTQVNEVVFLIPPPGTSLRSERSLVVLSGELSTKK
jgi:hypothetical protein